MRFLVVSVTFLKHSIWMEENLRIQRMEENLQVEKDQSFFCAVMFCVIKRCACVLCTHHLHCGDTK